MVSGLVAVSLGGCSTIGSWFGLGGGSSQSGDTQKIATRYLGSVAADDASAVGAGDNILRLHGNAADAATAMALTLTVSLPSRAGLMGGGVCLVRDAESASVDSITFLPPAAQGGSVPVPALVRGIAALQARYGTLDWRQIVVGVERLAQGGVPVSAQLQADAAAAGVALPPGQNHVEPALASVFSQLRINGVSDFYTGDLARQLVAAGVPGTALASYAPVWRQALQVASNHDTLFVPPTTGGRITAGAYGALMDQEDAAADPATRFQIARTGADAVAAKFGPAVAADQTTASTGFIVSDAAGRVVSCTLSMGSSLFGTRKKLGLPALYVAAPIAGDPAAERSLAPAIAYNANSSQVLGVFAGSAGTSAPADLAGVVFSMLRADKGAGTSVALLRRPGDTGATAVPDRVAALHCPDGLVRNPKTCGLARDPRGWGFAQTVDLVK